MTTITEGMTPAQFITAINANFVDIKYVPSAITTIDANSDITIINANFQDIKVDTILPPTTDLIVAGLSGANYISKLNSNFSNYENLFENRFLSLGFGTLIGFTMGTFTNDLVLLEEKPVDSFAPTDLDIDEWLDAYVAAGMGYAVLLVKGHDGFCLWPTAFAEAGYDPYSIAETTWYANNGNPDIVELFVDGCVLRGLKPCLYYSTYDVVHESRSGTNENTDAAAYIAMIQAQLTELVTNYGDLTAIWLDGWNGYLHYATIPFAPIFNTIKNIQPSCLVMTNDGLHPATNSEIEIYEQPSVIPEDNVLFCEETDAIRVDNGWITIDSQGQDASDYLTKTQINAQRIQANSRNGNYLIGTSPDKTGHLPAMQKTILESLTT